MIGQLLANRRNIEISMLIEFEDQDVLELMCIHFYDYIESGRFFFEKNVTEKEH